MAEPTPQSLNDMAMDLQNRISTISDLVSRMDNDRPDLVAILKQQIGGYNAAAEVAMKAVEKFQANQLALAIIKENAMLREAFEAGDETVEYDEAAFNGAGAYRRKTDGL